MGTVSNERIHVAVTFFASQRTKAGLYLYAAAHQRPVLSPFMPAELITPGFWTQGAAFNCSIGNDPACCEFAFVSHSFHVAFHVWGCGSTKLEDITSVRATFAAMVRLRGPDAGPRKRVFVPVDASICQSADTDGVQSKVGFASVCLGPVFGVSTAAQSRNFTHLKRQQDRVWQTWLAHNAQNGVDRVYAYGLDDAAGFFAEKVQSTISSSIVYSDFPRAWHVRAAFPVQGDPSRTGRQTVSSYYLTQSMVLQKCFVEHRAKQHWLISMDTDEFWRAGRTTLRAHLQGAQQREDEKTQVPFCRGHLDTTGNLTTVNAQKYAMRSIMCSDPLYAYMWIHYGSCGDNSSSLFRPTDAFDSDTQAARCVAGVGAVRRPFLDHKWRECFLPQGSSDAAGVCGALKCYPMISNSLHSCIADDNLHYETFDDDSATSRWY